MAESKNSILITGANGFLGSRLCRKFIEEGFHIIAGVRKSAELSLLNGVNVEYRYGDVTQKETLAEMVKGVDYIIHSAGLVKAKRKQRFFEVNESGTANLFEAISKYNPGIKKVVYISSAAASGPSIKGRPLTEDDPPHPITTYGHSKLAGEKMALSYAGKFNVVSIRPPGIYGPGDREVFPFFQAVYKGIRPYFGDSRRKIQMIEVDDLCEAVFLAATKYTPSGLVCFVAETQSYNTKEFIELLSDSCGKKGLSFYVPSFFIYLMAYITQVVAVLMGVKPVLTKEKADELLAPWEISTKRAEETFGFRSRIPFAQGAKLTYEWYLKEGWLK